MNNTVFSYYSGNIHYTRPLGTISFNEFIRVHKNPKIRTLKLLNKIKLASVNGDIKLKRELKQQLYAFTPSVLIKKNESRNYSNIEDWTGLMQLDFDKIENKKTALELKSHLFNEYKEIACAYLSPSELGVKCLLKITKPKNLDQYRAIFKTVENEMEQLSYFDSSTKNAVLPLFLSADKNILFTDLYCCSAWDKEDWSETKYIHLNNSNKSVFNPDFNIDSTRQYLLRKVIRITTTKVKNIIDNGHPQLRSASLILGSRVGANYISRFDAECLIVELINSNTYLNKNIEGYIKTAKWAISQGMLSPKYY